jgi:hypothetical protein
MGFAEICMNACMARAYDNKAKKACTDFELMDPRPLPGHPYFEVFIYTT